MSVMSWLELALELGEAVIKAIQSGETDKTVLDVLPEKYKDSEILKGLEEKAKQDYAK